MTDPTPLGRLDPTELMAARLELHHAVQLIAAFGQSFVPPRDDDSHRTMKWDPQQRAFTSEWGDTIPRLRLRIRPEGLQVSVWARDEAGPNGMRTEADEDNAERIAERSLRGVTLEDAYAWVESALDEALQAGAAGAEAEGFGPVKLRRPEYEMPMHPVVDGAVFSAEGMSSLQEVELWYSHASSALEGLVIGEADATEIRCWPHHFDIGTLIVLDPEVGSAKGRSVGVGFSPGDGGIPQPYWYPKLSDSHEKQQTSGTRGGAGLRNGARRTETHGMDCELVT